VEGIHSASRQPGLTNSRIYFDNVSADVTIGRKPAEYIGWP